MKPATPSTRKIRNRDGKSMSRRSLEAGRRGAAFKLEALEERTLLSTSKLMGPYLGPVGLGPNYTSMSEQAHGVGLTTTSPGQYVAGGTTSTSTSSPITLAELNAYLKSLKLNYDSITNAGAGVPPAYQNLGSPFQSNTNPVDVNPNGSTNYYLQNQDNPQQESQPVFSVNDQAAQLAYLKLHPQGTGLSTPPLNPTILSGFDGMNFTRFGQRLHTTRHRHGRRPAIRGRDRERADPDL